MGQSVKNLSKVLWLTIKPST
ncbi:hypothetical protein GO984_15185 [Rhodobacteraceae bacterium CY05]|uniref:Uncharacterized protein n=1 Tax=Parasedimentitalea huanghaiensis TaxID=2682100 RepID=A0A6L6WKN7_9RHOB|nr:hypothetical protein [Zongyanglinia huanghaiensis]